MQKFLWVLGILLTSGIAYADPKLPIGCPAATIGQTAAQCASNGWQWVAKVDASKVLRANNATTPDYFQGTWQTYGSLGPNDRLWVCQADRPVGSTVTCGGQEGFVAKSTIGPPDPPTPPAYTEPRTLSWTAPTLNADGTPLTDLAGYRLARGTASGVYTENIILGLVNTYTFPALGVGTHFAGVYARDDDGNESVRSNELSFTVVDPGTPLPQVCTAPQPPDQTRNQSCPSPQTGSWTQTNAFVTAPFPTCWVPGNNWIPVNPPPGACIDPPPTQTLRVVAVVAGLSHSPAFGITAAGARGTAVVGFVPVGTVCTGSVIYRYRSQDYYRVAAGTTVWWATTPTANAAIACRLQ